MAAADGGYAAPVTVPAPRVLMGIAASLIVLGLALTISDSGEALPARPTQRAVMSVPMAKPPVGVLIDPYTRAAAACQGLDPAILVAIHDVETRRDARGATSTAGALGPMQFLPDTWMAYGVDADHDGRADVWDLNDALAGAAHLLCANGVADPATRASAIWNYNHSWAYVNLVLGRVDELHAAGVPA